MNYELAKREVEQGMETLRAKGFVMVEASLTTRLPEEDFYGVIYYRTPGGRAPKKPSTILCARPGT